jgi:hypothetical protein
MVQGELMTLTTPKNKNITGISQENNLPHHADRPSIVAVSHAGQLDV